jgi:diacylglycerol O-acyltransferase / wax synthase
VEQLTGLDNAFLSMETPGIYGHVGSVCVVDPSTRAEPFDLHALTSLVEARLPLVPIFRRKLLEVPLGLDHPYWVDDPHFDIEYHIREIALPEPGSDRQLEEQVARIHARRLDRDHPLWEMYLIHGLHDGRAAIYTKVHHAAIDGISGTDLLTAILDPSPDGRDLPEPAPYDPEPSPSSAELAARTAVSLAGHPGRALRLVSELIASAPALVATTIARVPQLNRLPFVGRASRVDDDVVLAQPGLRAPETPFNAPLSAHRRWAFADISLSEVKRIKNAAGVTVNDVVMSICAGALRRWLVDHDALPDEPLVAAVPISVRTEEQRGQHGNQVAVMFAGLPTQVATALERLEAVHDEMRVAKEQFGATPAGLLSDASQFATPVLANQAWRVAARLRLLERLNPWNLFISNVPGPSMQLYYAGAPLLAYYPVSALPEGQGLNITVLSYRDQLHFGLVADRYLVPDLDNLVVHLHDEVKALSAEVPG